MSSRVHEKDPSPFPRSRCMCVFVCKRQRHKEREGIKSIVSTISKSRFFFRFLFLLLENRFPSDARDIISLHSIKRYTILQHWLHRAHTLSAQTVAEWISFYSSPVFLLPLYLTPFRLEIAYDPVFSRTLTKKAHRDTNRREKKRK